MASKTPATSATSGYVEPTDGLWVAVGAAASARLALGKAIASRSGLATSIFYFADIDDGDTWDAAPPRCVASFWSGDTGDSDAANVTVTTAAGQNSQLTFETNGESNLNGWVLVFHEG